MPHRVSRWLVVLTLFLAVYLSVPAYANTGILDATCTGAATVVTVDLDVSTPMPPAWTGWVVGRMAIGPCEDLTQLFGPTAFPAGSGSWTFTDESASSGVAYKYFLRAVDAQGVRHDFTDEALIDPWTTDTYTVCAGASAVRGSLGGYDGNRAWMFTCGDGCWEYISYVQGLPAGLLPFVGTDTMVELIGVLHMGPEGPYITDVSDWRLPSACDAVATQQLSWGAIKASYR